MPSYHIVDLKQQNRLKVGTNKPQLKGKMQSVSDDDVRKTLLEKPHFEQTAKDIRMGKQKLASSLPKVGFQLA